MGATTALPDPSAQPTESALDLPVNKLLEELWSTYEKEPSRSQRGEAPGEVEDQSGGTATMPSSEGAARTRLQKGESAGQSADLDRPLARAAELGQNEPAVAPDLSGHGERGLLEPQDHVEKREQESPPAEVPGSVVRVRHHRRGRPKQERPRIPWLEVDGLAKDAIALQETAVSRFQSLLDSLIGTEGQTEPESQALAAIITDTAERVGIEFTDRNHVVTFRRKNGVFETRSTIDGKTQTLSAGAAFPKLVARAKAPIPAGADISVEKWVTLARNSRPSDGVGSPGS